MRLLVTRPGSDAERTAAALRARGCEVMVAALLQVETMTPALGEGPWRGLVLTSANAVRALEQHPRRPQLVALPAFVVGRRTGAAARTAGFAEIHSADGDAQDLVRLIAARAVGGPLLYLAGEDRAHDLAAALSGQGMTVETAVVYRAVPMSGLPAAVAAALAAGRLDGVLHYSRRSAEAYLDCARAAGLREQALALVHFCLSEAVAEPLRHANVKDIRVAPRPEEGALLDLIAIT